MPRNRLPRVMKNYSPTGRRNHGRPLKRLLDTWDRNGSTSGATPWQIYDDDDDDDYEDDDDEKPQSVRPSSWLTLETIISSTKSKMSTPLILTAQQITL